MPFPSNYTLLPGHALGLKAIYPNGRTYGGFEWPQTVGAEVVAPDWAPYRECGHGLHLWAYGTGDLGAANVDREADDTIWQVVDYIVAEAVDLSGKIKAPRCTVVHVGRGPTARAECANMIIAYCPGHATHYGTATTGYRGTATAGDYGTATTGYWGTATAGYRGTATAGDYGTATAGDYGTATAGDYGTATAGDGGTATAGDYGTATTGCEGTATAGDYGTATTGYRGTATAGCEGTATAGDGGTATAGYRGTATAGDGGTATAGYRGTATAGDGGVLSLLWYNSERGANERKVAVVNGKGIEPNVAYRLNDAGRFVRADKGGK